MVAIALKIVFSKPPSWHPGPHAPRKAQGSLGYPRIAQTGAPDGPRGAQGNPPRSSIFKNRFCEFSPRTRIFKNHFCEFSPRTSIFKIPSLRNVLQLVFLKIMFASSALELFKNHFCEFSPRTSIFKIPGLAETSPGQRKDTQGSLRRAQGSLGMPSTSKESSGPPRKSRKPWRAQASPGRLTILSAARFFPPALEFVRGQVSNGFQCPRERPGMPWRPKAFLGFQRLSCPELSRALLCFPGLQGISLSVRGPPDCQ